MHFPLYFPSLSPEFFCGLHLSRVFIASLPIFKKFAFFVGEKLAEAGILLQRLCTTCLAVFQYLSPAHPHRFLSIHLSGVRKGHVLKKMVCRGTFPWVGGLGATGSPPGGWGGIDGVGPPLRHRGGDGPPLQGPENFRLYGRAENSKRESTYVSGIRAIFMVSRACKLLMWSELIFSV